MARTTRPRRSRGTLRASFYVKGTLPLSKAPVATIIAELLFGRVRFGVSFPISGPVVVAMRRNLVGVAGFEPATPSSRTSEAFGKLSVYWRV